MFMTSETFARYAETLERLHVPVATSRRIAFLTTGTNADFQVMTRVAAMFRSVPGRRVVIQESTRPSRQEIAVVRNADIVCTNAGTVSTLHNAASMARQHHALCLIASAERAEADPALAIGTTLATDYGIAPLLALTAGSGSRTSTAWAKLIARKMPEWITLVPATQGLLLRRGDLAIAALAGALLSAALDSPVPFVRRGDSPRPDRTGPCAGEKA